MTEPSIHYHAYELRSQQALNARSTRRLHSGVLLRQGSGFACLHPWPELGDAPLPQQLEALRRGMDTPLTKAARHCLRIDGAARAAGISLFHKAAIPESHATLITPHLDAVNQAAIQGFTIAKIKAAPENLKAIANLLEQSPIPLRLDFNETLTWESADRFLGSLNKTQRACLDFIEDPLPYNPDAWKQLHSKHGCRLALDRHSAQATHGHQVIVLKPAVDDLEKMTQFISKTSCPFVVTSYMDHPLGQLYAAYCAINLRQANTAIDLPCGIATHLLFEPDPFTESLGNGPFLTVPPGFGLGFDDLLEHLPWRRL